MRHDTIGRGMRISGGIKWLLVFILALAMVLQPMVPAFGASVYAEEEQKETTAVTVEAPIIVKIEQPAAEPDAEAPAEAEAVAAEKEKTAAKAATDGTGEEETKTKALMGNPVKAEKAGDGSNDSDSSFDKMGSKTAGPTVLKEDRKTTITLEMPSGEYKQAVDIVFVMDKSTSIANSGYDFAANVKSLFDSIIENNPDINLKVGVVKFRGYATDMLKSGLTKYQDNVDAILEAISSDSVPGSGSNAHSGLIMADKMLEDDSEVSANNKYVVFLTDGKNYIWNNDDDEPTTYYAQYAERTSVKNSGKPTLNQKAGIYNKEQGKTYCTVPQIPGRETVNFVDKDYKADGTTSAYYARLFNSTNSELSSTNTKYDSPAYYSKYYDPATYTGDLTTGDGTVVKRALTNGASIFNVNGQQPFRDYYDYTPDPSTFWADINYLQLNPYEVVENSDGTYSYDTSKVNEDFFLWHPDQFQKGTYQAGHYWKDVMVEKYKAASVSFAPKSGGGTNLADSFHHWLLENSDYGADIKNSDSVIEMFKDIDNSIRYMVDEGVVTDEIADEFALDKPSDGSSPFTMTYDGEALPSTGGGDNTWNFGEPDEDGVYPYSVEYDESTKTFRWIVRVPIENAKRISLSYGLILGEEYPEGEYDTNKSAVLDYVTTDGDKGAFTFEKPKVSISQQEEGESDNPDNPNTDPEEEDKPSKNNSDKKSSNSSKTNKTGTENKTGDYGMTCWFLLLSFSFAAILVLLGNKRRIRSSR